MSLIKNGRAVDDPWIALDDDAPLPATGPVIVSLTRLRAQRDALLSRRAPLGVRLKSSELAGEIGADAAALELGQGGPRPLVGPGGGQADGGAYGRD